MAPARDGYESALTKNFSFMLKIELVYRTSRATCDDAENAFFGYVNG